MYTLTEIHALISNGFEYRLPDIIMASINELSGQVGAPNYVKTPVFTKRNVDFSKERERDKDKKKKYPKKKKQEDKGGSDNWNRVITPFNATKLEKSTGLKKNTDDIRLQLNKLTDKNYIDIRKLIYDVLDGIDEVDFDANILSNIIFDLASSNRFYSNTYAQLFADLMTRYEYMKPAFENSIQSYTVMFDDIKYVEPNDNYEEFCEINKINEKRKSTSMFFVNMMKNNIIARERIISFLLILLNKFEEFIHLPDKKNEVNEICENFGILFDPKEDYTNDAKINDLIISEYLTKVAKSKVSDYKSFTNKTKFKIMDLLGI